MADAAPSTPRHKYLNRDQRLQIQTLRLAGHTYAFIASLLNFTERQVAYASPTNTCDSHRYQLALWLYSS
jgi:hypothetical protein